MDGACDNAIIDDMAWQMALGGDFSAAEDSPLYANHGDGTPDAAARYHCDTKVKVDGLPAYSIDIALPVRTDLQRLLSLLITLRKDSGAWGDADREARRVHMSPSTCTFEAIALTSKSLDFATGAGVVFFSVACTTLGLLFNAIYRCTPGQRKARKWGKQAAYAAAAKALGINLDDEPHYVKLKRAEKKEQAAQKKEEKVVESFSEIEKPKTPAPHGGRRPGLSGPGLSRRRERRMRESGEGVCANR